MDLTTIISLFLAVAMGLSLGLFGGGGSILTLPILVYVMGIDPVIGTAYSLFVVGTTSLLGSVRHMIAKNIAYKEGLIFAIPSIIAVYITRSAIVPHLPHSFFSGKITLNTAIMVLFAVVMLAAAISMLLKRPNKKEGPVKINYLMIVVEGMIVGFVTGLIGAGGGFLIVPALVLFVGLDIKKAVATSLMIISAKSLIGFTGDLNTEIIIEWSVLIPFTLASLVGMGLGLVLAKKISAESLRKAFGYFILIMAVFIFFKEILNS